MHLTGYLVPLLLTSLPGMLANPVGSPNEDAVLRKGDLLGQLCGSSINETMSWEDMTTNCGGNSNKLILQCQEGSLKHWRWKELFKCAKEGPIQQYCYFDGSVATCRNGA